MKQIGQQTTYPALKAYRKFLNGEITAAEFTKAATKPIITPIYATVGK